MPSIDPSRFQGMSMEAVLDIAKRTVETGVDALNEARSIYQLCLQQDIGLYPNGVIHQFLWGVERKLGLHPLFPSQAGQDRFVYRHFFKEKKNGVFVEIGGYDGLDGSNCYFFEKNRNWSGLVVEASPMLIDKIRETRDAEVVHAALSKEDGKAEFLEITSGYTMMSGLTAHFSSQRFDILRSAAKHVERKIEVPTRRLDTLLREHGIDAVDYCSIDVEGAERAILSDFDFGAFDISVLSVENNSRLEADSYRDILEPAGYRLVVVLGSDEIWAKTELADAAEL